MGRRILPGGLRGTLSKEERSLGGRDYFSASEGGSALPFRGSGLQLKKGVDPDLPHITKTARRSRKGGGKGIRTSQLAQDLEGWKKEGGKPRRRGTPVREKGVERKFNHRVKKPEPRKKERGIRRLSPGLPLPTAFKKKEKQKKPVLIGLEGGTLKKKEEAPPSLGRPKSREKGNIDHSEGVQKDLVVTRLWGRRGRRHWFSTAGQKKVGPCGQR